MRGFEPSKYAFGLPNKHRGTWNCHSNVAAQICVNVQAVRTNLIRADIGMAVPGSAVFVGKPEGILGWLESTHTI